MVKKTTDLIKLSQEIRKKCIEISANNKIPHLGSCLSCSDILTVLFWKEMNLNPKGKDIDQFILSKGHASPVYLQVLAKRGYFKESKLNRFGENGSIFHEHPPHPKMLNGVKGATGSLGHGFS